MLGMQFRLLLHVALLIYLVGPRLWLLCLNRLLLMLNLLMQLLQLFMLQLWVIGNILLLLLLLTRKMLLQMLLLTGKLLLLLIGVVLLLVFTCVTELFNQSGCSSGDCCHDCGCAQGLQVCSGKALSGSSNAMKQSI